MDTDSFLRQALIYLGAGIIAVPIFTRLGAGSVLGYLVAGIIIGPWGLRLITQAHTVLEFAELGIVLLLFLVGLELNVTRVWQLRRAIFGLGAAQVLLTTAAIALIGVALGQPLVVGVVAGMGIAMSSTAIGLALLEEKNLLPTPGGQASFAVLLFQDLAVIPLLVLIPALALSTGEIAATIGVALAKAAVVLAIVLFLGQRLMRPLFDGVARLKSSELFVLFVLLVTLGLAWVTGLAGLSLALGAFLAGMLISETEYRYQVEDYIKPFRDVLLGLFFVTIGMLLDPAALAAHWAAVLAVFAALLIVKFAVIYALARAFAAAKPVALRAALALAPAGEFGFVLLALAESARALDRPTLQVVLAATLLSMLAAPLVLQRMDSIVLHLVESEWTERAVALHTLAVKSMATRGHVIVCGYGRSGQALAQFLEREGIPVIALDSDPERVRQAAAAGDSVVFGDASRREVLIAAALARAAALVVSFADTPRALSILAHVRDLRPELPVVVRTFDDSEVERLRDAGAAEIVAEVVEGSLMLATQTMMQLGIPLNRVLRRLRDAREERYRHMRGFFRGATDEDTAEADQPRLHTVLVGPNAACIGASLGGLRLDSLRVEVTAVRRKGTREVNPGPETRLQADDVVVLLGAPSDIARAEIRLLQG